MRLTPKTLELVRGRIERLPLFDASEYAELNPDVPAPLDPAQHYVDHGIWEKRPIATSPRIARLLASVPVGTAPQQPWDHDVAAVLSNIYKLDVGVFASSRGNFFMREIAEHVVRDLASLGVRARVLDEMSPHGERPDVCIFVAPHEFFLLGKGREWSREEILSTAFMLSTEQVHTPWFLESLPYLLPARGIIDGNAQTLDFFRTAGVPTLFYFPGFSATQGADGAPPNHALARGLTNEALSYRATSDDPWLARPIDIMFTGASSPVRDDFFGRHAGDLADLTSFVYLVRPFRLPLSLAEDEPRPALNRFVARRSKIVLNLHQNEIGYFEWHRMVIQGMWQGALVISDPCLPHPIFKPGIHYLEDIPRRIPKLVRWLIGTERGRRTAERIRGEALAALAEHAASRKMALRLSKFLLHSTPGSDDVPHQSANGPRFEPGTFNNKRLGGSGDQPLQL